MQILREDDQTNIDKSHVYWSGKEWNRKERSASGDCVAECLWEGPKDAEEDWVMFVCL